MQFCIAQTHLQLYRQMRDAGADPAELVEANEAYMFAARLTAGIFRGSGKPFVCHLVGAASVMVEAGERGACIPASLLHAVYQDRLPFPGGETLQQRRDIVIRTFGNEVDALIHTYHLSEARSITQLVIDDSGTLRLVALMRLADEIDDLVDDGPCLHGRPGDDVSVRGSAAARLALAAGQVPLYLKAAQQLAAPTLCAHFERWLAQRDTREWPAALRSGECSSYTVPTLAALHPQVQSG